MPEQTWAFTGLEVLHPTDFLGGRLDRPGTAVVCFGATWCPVTRRFLPRFLALNGRVRGTLMIADISDRDDPLWDVFHIRITPSILVFDDGALRTRIDGRRMIGITSAALARFEAQLSPRSVSGPVAAP